jgi:hypothetical protein
MDGRSSSEASQAAWVRVTPPIALAVAVVMLCGGARVDEPRPRSRAAVAVTAAYSYDGNPHNHNEVLL